MVVPCSLISLFYIWSQGLVSLTLHTRGQAQSCEDKQKKFALFPFLSEKGKRVFCVFGLIKISPPPPSQQSAKIPRGAPYSADTAKTTHDNSLWYTGPDQENSPQQRRSEADLRICKGFVRNCSVKKISGHFAPRQIALPSPPPPTPTLPKASRVVT